jgi:hypothetical protein
MSIDSPPPDPQLGEPRDPRDHRYCVTTYVYDGQGQLASVLVENGPGPMTHAAPSFSVHWEHIPDKGLFALTAEGNAEYWRDNPTRYLVVESDAETGIIMPPLKYGSPGRATLGWCKLDLAPANSSCSILLFLLR